MLGNRQPRGLGSLGNPLVVGKMLGLVKVIGEDQASREDVLEAMEGFVIGLFGVFADLFRGGSRDHCWGFIVWGSWWGGVRLLGLMPYHWWDVVGRAVSERGRGWIPKQWLVFLRVIRPDPSIFRRYWSWWRTSTTRLVLSNLGG